MEIRELAAMPAMGPQFAKALLPSFHRGPATVPSHAVQVTGLSQDRAQLAAYDRVCGFTVRDEVSPTWLHVLTFPLQVALLSDPGSTVRLAGVVHVSNRMRLHRPVRAEERLDATVHIEGLRPHHRGALLDLVGEIHIGDELVWEGVSTYLASGAVVGGGCRPTWDGNTARSPVIRTRSIPTGWPRRRSASPVPSFTGCGPMLGCWPASRRGCHPPTK